ncbi:hypothetical protein T09_4877 [Trichinella sp. T9]|nr:hypothetical protein T09_4877 [Trichinella sp. T9]
MVILNTALLARILPRKERMYNREQNDIVIDEINQTLENVGVYTEERLVTSSGPGETERSTETSTFVDDGSAMLELRKKRLYSSESISISSIRRGKAKLIRHAPRLSQLEYEESVAAINNMEQDGIMQLSQSAWAARVLPLRKKLKTALRFTMYFDTVFRQTKSGRNVRQIVVLPDPDLSEPDTVSDDELDRLSQRSHDSIEDKDDAFFNAISSLKQQHCLVNNYCYYLAFPIDYLTRYFTPKLLSHISCDTSRKANQRLFSNLEEAKAEIEVLTGRNVRQIVVLPDPDVSEPDTVGEPNAWTLWQIARVAMDSKHYCDFFTLTIMARLSLTMLSTIDSTNFGCF